jgi:hypothetical protein
MMSRRTLALLPFLVVCACSSSSSKQEALPSAADILAFTRVTNLLTVPVDVEGTTALLFVDTGSPIVLLSPTRFPQAPAIGSVSTLSVESDDVANLQVVTSSVVPPSPDPSVPVGGVLGCTVFCTSVMSFNYRDAIFTIGSPTPPSGLKPETVIGFSFKGGSTVQVGSTPVAIPRSRIVVSVDIEGTAHKMIVDSGATAVTVNQALFAEITEDGRAEVSGGSLTSTLGMSTTTLTRTKTLGIAGAQAERVVVAYDSSFDTNLSAVSTDAGETIEGSLGGTFLENFYVTVDYPNRKVHFAPYTDTSFILDPGATLGFALTLSGSTYSVAEVFSGTAAATKGVGVGDVIVAIDGQTLASLTLSKVAVLAGGKVGSTKSVQFGAAETLADKTLSFTMTDLLPLPQ